MIDVSYNNWMKFGWGDETYNVHNPSGKFWVKYSSASYIPTSFRQEFIRSIKLITENNSKPIVVHASGGCDSEALCLTLKELDIPYTISILKMIYKSSNHANNHDTKYIYKFAAENKIPYVETSIDFEQFMTTRFLEEAHLYKTFRIGMVLQGELIRYFPDHLNLFGDGRFTLTRYKEVGIQQDGFFVSTDPGLLHTHFLGLKYGIDVVRRVFMYTPEQMLCFLIDPDVAHWIKYERSFYSAIKKHGTINWEQIKRYMTHRHFPEIQPRPKFTGFEQIDFFKYPESNQKCSEIWKEINNLYNGQNLVRDIMNYETLYSILLPKQE